MRITVISDTHGKHNEITKDLPGGDLLLCSGDISGRGYQEEIKNFVKWFEDQDYEEKIFIAGNHDFGFQDSYQKTMDLIGDYDVEYLQDNLVLYYPEQELYDLEVNYSDYIKIYGSPWQPEFCNWAFNLPRNGDRLKEKWNNISPDTDILLTHGPSWGNLDIVKGRKENLGCELLQARINRIKPKIHICGHIHSGYGYKFENGTHFFNASVLNEKYQYTQKPMTFDWNREINEINFL